jgi:hypothetical protein
MKVSASIARRHTEERIRIPARPRESGVLSAIRHQAQSVTDRQSKLDSRLRRNEQRKMLEPALIRTLYLAMTMMMDCRHILYEDAASPVLRPCRELCQRGINSIEAAHQSRLNNGGVFRQSRALSGDGHIGKHRLFGCREASRQAAKSLAVGNLLRRTKVLDCEFSGLFPDHDGSQPGREGSSQAAFGQSHHHLTADRACFTRRTAPMQ